jgi:hypothetical protein
MGQINISSYDETTEHNINEMTRQLHKRDNYKGPGFFYA